jgi:hypothetical protein
MLDVACTKVFGVKTGDELPEDGFNANSDLGV